MSVYEDFTYFVGFVIGIEVLEVGFYSGLIYRGTGFACLII